MGECRYSFPSWSNFALDSHDLSSSRRRRNIPDIHLQKDGCTIAWTFLPLPGIVAKKSEEKAARQCKEEREGNKGYEWKEKEKKKSY
jgi:hypothetical protein